MAESPESLQKSIDSIYFVFMGLGALIVIPSIVGVLKKHVSSFLENWIFGRGKQIAELGNSMKELNARLNAIESKIEGFEIEVLEHSKQIVAIEKHNERLDATLSAHHEETLRAITDVNGNVARLVDRFDKHLRHEN